MVAAADAETHAFVLLVLTRCDNPYARPADTTQGRLGVDPAYLFTDRGLTGTDRARPGLREALAACGDGDTLVVAKLDPSVDDAGSAVVDVAAVPERDDDQ